MSHSLSDLAQALLGAAKRAGADGADVIAVDGRSVSIDVLGGALEHAERSEGTEVGLRVLVGQRQACVSSSLIDPGTIETMAERAVFMAREAPEDPYIGLAEAAQFSAVRDADALDLADPAPEPETGSIKGI